MTGRTGPASRRYFAEGFASTGSTSTSRCWPRTTTRARSVCPVATMRSAFVEQGHATAEAIDDYLASLADPGFWFVANSVVAAWGRRPSTDTRSRRRRHPR